MTIVICFAALLCFAFAFGSKPGPVDVKIADASPALFGSHAIIVAAALATMCYLLTLAAEIGW